MPFRRTGRTRIPPSCPLALSFPAQVTSLLRLATPCRLSVTPALHRCQLCMCTGHWEPAEAGRPLTAAPALRPGAGPEAQERHPGLHWSRVCKSAPLEAKQFASLQRHKQQARPCEASTSPHPTPSSKARPTLTVSSGRGFLIKAPVSHATPAPTVVCFSLVILPLAIGLNPADGVSPPFSSHT